MRARVRRLLVLVTAVVACVSAFAGIALAAAITQPASGPFAVPGDPSGNPQPFTIAATGYAANTLVSVEQCDGVAPSSPGWSPAVHCDLGSSPAPSLSDGSGNVTVLASDVNKRFTPFKGESPQSLFNCLAPGDPSPGNGLPDFTNCQLRVSTNNLAVTGDQAFLVLTLPAASQATTTTTLAPTTTTVPPTTTTMAPTTTTLPGVTTTTNTALTTTTTLPPTTTTTATTSTTTTTTLPPTTTTTKATTTTTTVPPTTTTQAPTTTTAPPTTTTIVDNGTTTSTVSEERSTTSSTVDVERTTPTTSATVDVAAGEGSGSGSGSGSLPTTGASTVALALAALSALALGALLLGGSRRTRRA